MPRGVPKKKTVVPNSEAVVDEAQQPGVDHDPDVTPAFRQAMKLKAQAKAQQPNPAVSSYVEMVASPFQRIKYRRVTVMQNGNVHRTPISEDQYKREAGARR